MKREYLPKTLGGKLGWLDEECHEVGQAVAKTLRIALEENSLLFALNSSNPELPPEERETNREWILREIQDLKFAIAEVEAALQ